MISVCMATYNGEKFIEEQLNSIQSQISLEDEIIIVDDMSTDNTIKLIEEQHDARIKLSQNTMNMGPIKTFEKALLLSKGDYIFLCDQDDVWLPNKVSEVMKMFENDKYSLVIHDAKVTDKNLKVIADSWNTYNHNIVTQSWIRTLIKNPFTGAAMCLRRDILNRILPFPDTIPMHDWWIGAICQKDKFQIMVSSKKLMLYRRHGNNVTGNSHEIKQMLFGRWHLLQALLKVG